MRDPYFFDDCDILKNKLGIKDEDRLDHAEVEFSCERIHDLARSMLPGNYDFAHYCEMHQYIFGDIYEWAGQPRNVPMEKAESLLGYMSIDYAEPQDIEKQANAVLERMNSRDWLNMSLDEQAERLAQDTADLWKVHCFREGTTRTTITFMCQFADSHDMPIDRTLFERNAGYTRNALVAACAIFKDGDFRKPEYLFNIIKDGLKRGLDDRKDDRKQMMEMSDWKQQINREKKDNPIEKRGREKERTGKER